MQNCRNNNPYMRRANCGCGNNNNSCNSNSCMANNDGRNPSMAVPVYRERSGCSDRDDALDGMPIAMAYLVFIRVRQRKIQFVVFDFSVCIRQ